MKHIVILLMVFLLAISVGCSGVQNINGNSPVVSVSKTPEPSATETVQSAVPTENTSSPSAISSPSNETPVIENGPIPGLLGNQWYDFDKAGAYPGACVVQCGDRIAFNNIIKTEGIMEYDSYLCFADPDGSNCVQTKVSSEYPNYKDGWVYFTYYADHADCIYKIKTDGSGLTKIFKAQSSIEGTTGIALNDLLLVGNQIYVFEYIVHDKKATSIFMRMNLDGSGIEELDEFDHIGIPDEYLHLLPTSLYYDSGKLYYVNADKRNTKFDLYQYDISTNEKTCLAKDLASNFCCKIAVRGDKIYYAGEKGLSVFIISTGKNEVFAPTKNIAFLDFGFFDRWLLMTSDDGLYCYDLESGKLYLDEDSAGITANIVATQKYVFLEEAEDYPYLFPVTFQNGEINIGGIFNEIK